MQKTKAYKLKLLWIIAILVLFSSYKADYLFAIGEIYSPEVEYGEYEIEMVNVFNFNDINKAEDNAFTSQFSVTGSLFDFWATEIYFVARKVGLDNFQSSQIKWSHLFEFLEEKEFGVGFGGYFEYIFSLKDNLADKIEGKLLFEKLIGKINTILNLTLEREVGSNASNSLELVTATNISYKTKTGNEIGVEIFTESEDIRDIFEENSLFLGPLFAVLIDDFKFKISFLKDILNGALALKTELEYEFEL